MEDAQIHALGIQGVVTKHLFSLGLGTHPRTGQRRLCHLGAAILEGGRERRREMQRKQDSQGRLHILCLAIMEGFSEVVAKD